MKRSTEPEKSSFGEQLLIDILRAPLEASLPIILEGMPDFS
jgi:hypothetical protein